MPWAQVPPRWRVTMTELDCPVLVFTRAPVPGKVKTRLAQSLGATGAAELYQRLVHATLQTVSASGLGPVELWCTPSTGHPFLRRCAVGFGARLRRQQGASLGARMHFALHRALRRHKRALLIGCDCPELSVADLSAASRLLGQGTDIVLGPAEDGGFYLIGLTASCSRLFHGIRWGRPDVLERMRANIRALGLQCRELTERWDLDRPPDLERAKRAHAGLFPTRISA